MRMSPSLIFYMLSLEYSVSVIHESGPLDEVVLPMLYDDTLAQTDKVSVNTLLICSTMDHLETAPDDSCSYLICNTDEQTAAHSTCTRPCALVQGETSPVHLLYRVFALMCRLQEWDGKMKDLLQQGAEIDDFLAYSHTCFSQHYFLADTHYNYVSYTPGVFGLAPRLAPENSQLTIPVEVINDLLLDREFLEADKQRGVALYHSNTNSDDSLYVNFFRNNEYMARLLTPIRHEQVLQGEKEVMVALAHYVEQAYFFHLDERTLNRQSDRFHTLAEKLLDAVPSKELYATLEDLANLGWMENHRYKVSVIRIFSVREYELSAAFLCNQLESACPGTVALLRDTDVVWVMNASLYRGSLEKDSMAIIKRILSGFICKAGISSTQEGLSGVNLLYRQAFDALRLGETCDPHFRYYRFEQYLYEYLLERMGSEYPGSHLAHAGITKLLESDVDSGTEYVKHLRCYIAAGFNVSKAADLAFVHRSTLIRQLARIKKLSGIDFSHTIDLKDFAHLLHTLALVNSD